MSQVIALRHPIIRHRMSKHRAKRATILHFFPLRRDTSSDWPIKMGTAVVHRVQEALNGAYTDAGMGQEIRKALDEITRRFKQYLKTMPYRQLVDEGHVNQLLDDYLGLLMTAHEAGAQQYSDEREYYCRHPQAVKNIALYLKFFLIQ